MTHTVLEPRGWTVRLTAGLILLALCLIAAVSAQAAPAASLSRSAEVDATPAEVWALIGPFCAIEKWHPAIASCTEEGNPPTRTLEAKDGKTEFVEPEVNRSDEEHYYSYAFQSSPFPVTDYMATIRVVPKGADHSIVIWNGSYVPNAGKAEEANKLFADIYEAGLASIKAHFSR
ncbi:MAG TPA: SRPBCC family protein [Alphaproteobacteria bacterium]|nr:SRPBCC family protein [Alphaproteobacteria bacterium]